MREALSLEEVCSESLDDYRVRQHAWDARKEDCYKHWKGKQPEPPTGIMYIKVVNQHGVNQLGEGRGIHPEVRVRSPLLRSPLFQARAPPGRTLAAQPF